MKVENWYGYDIRFVDVDGEWWAVFKDICEALGMHPDFMAQRLAPDMLTRAQVETKDDNKTHWMLVINESGIYELLFESRQIDARKFRRWTTTVLQKLRKNVGLEQYEVMRMTDEDIQDEIDHMLDTLFYDEETGMLMQSVTIQGGDVEQVPFL